MRDICMLAELPIQSSPGWSQVYIHAAIKYSGILGALHISYRRNFTDLLHIVSRYLNVRMCTASY